MDQTKITKLLRLMKLLTGNVSHTIDQLARGMVAAHFILGLSDDEIIAKIKKRPIPVLWFKTHGGGMTYESMAKKLLTDN